MKTTYILLLECFMIILFNSCDVGSSLDLEDSELVIEFSDGQLLTEKQIAFYDSSTHTFFLKSNLASKDSFTDFVLKIDGDSLLGGVFHSCFLSSFPPTPYYISDCFFSGSDIVTIAYYGTGENLLNDSRVVNALVDNNLFRHGLSLRIDSVDVIKTDGRTDVVSTITITNCDDIAYYIPDIDKMGEQYYTDYTGSLSFSEVNTGLGSFIKDSNGNRQRDDIDFDDLVKLKANSQLTYTYTSRNYHAIPEGEYNVTAHFMGIVYTARDFKLDQDDGRIWVGTISASKVIVVE